MRPCASPSADVIRAPGHCWPFARRLTLSWNRPRNGHRAAVAGELPFAGVIRMAGTMLSAHGLARERHCVERMRGRHCAGILGLYAK